MARLVFGMSRSLDGYVDDAAGTLCMPGPAVFRHFVDVAAGHAGAIYGRRAAVSPLIDEYRLYFRPYVLGGGEPYSSARGRRCASSRPIASARTWCG